jgi:type II secretory pathway component GspD/PulD (secretin)
LLKKAAGATTKVKDESAGDKRVPQEQFTTLVDLLESRGYIKILMNPTLEVVDGGTAKIRSKQDSLEDSIQITPHVSKDGNIILQVEATLSFESTRQDNEQTPIISTHEIATSIRLSPGESGIIGGMNQTGLLTEPGKDAKDSEVPSKEMLVILTPTIVASVEPKEPMETVNFQNEEAGTVIEKLAEWTGKTIIPPADLLKQEITIYSPEQMPRSEAAAMILNSLRSKGYTAEQSDETILLKPAKVEQPGIGKTQIMIDSKILTASDEFMKYIGLDPNSAASSESWSKYLVHSSEDSASFVVDQLHTDLILKAVATRMRTHKDIQMLNKPQILAKAGKKCEIHILESEYYMLRAPTEPNGSSERPESKSKRIELGTTIRLTPNLTPDGKNVELDFEWEYRRLRGIKEHTGPDGNVQKIPQVDIDSIKTPCTIPDGKTLLITGKHITVQKKKEPRKLGLADLPLIGRFFYSPPQVEETRNLLIMVKPSTDIKTTPTLQPLDPNDPLIKQIEEKFNR